MSSTPKELYSDAIPYIMSSASIEYLIEHSKHSKEYYLWKVCRKGGLSFCKALIESGVDVNTTLGNKKHYSYNYWPPLCVAARYGRLEICKLLLENGAKLNTYCFGICPLEAAAVNNAADVCELLIEHGASVTEGDSTPIHMAVGWAAFESLQVMCKHLKLKDRRLFLSYDPESTKYDVTNTCRQAVYIKDRFIELREEALRKKDCAFLLFLTRKYQSDSVWYEDSMPKDIFYLLLKYSDIDLKNLFEELREDSKLCNGPLFTKKRKIEIF